MRTLWFFLLIGLASAQSYQLELLVNDAPVAYTLEGATLEGDIIRASQGVVTAHFEAGKLELLLSDWDIFDHAHVLAVRFQKSADSYTVTATVRHHDQGWENYADRFEVRGEQVENGLRILLHPHDTEQPFTRSQTGVIAKGLVWVEAKDNVTTTPGSKIFLDLAHFENPDEISITYELQRLE